MKNKQKVFLPGAAALFFAAFALSLPGLSFAGETAKIKIITKPQTLNAGAMSGVFTIEAQDDENLNAPVATTTRVSLSSSSSTGKFYSSPASGPCGSELSPLSVTIAKNTARKSFCYSDETAGSWIISLSVPDQPGLAGDLQAITIILSSPGASTTPDSTATTTPESSATTTPESQPQVQNQEQNNPAFQQSGGQPQYQAKSDQVKITEILPNPEGEDSGKEAVEIRNFGTQTIDLTGWILGDKTETGPKPNSFILGETIIQPGASLAMVIPKGHFALNNSGEETVNLNFADKILADSVSYEGMVPENLSFQKTDIGWLWLEPTLGQNNPAGPPPAADLGIGISEIMPNPLGSDEGNEWAEIRNDSGSPVSLKGFYLDDGGGESLGSDAWELDAEAVVPAKGFLLLKIPEDKFSLSNTEDSLRLFDPAKKLVEEISYAQAPENQSWARDAKSQWAYGLPTPGEENLSELPDYKIVISEILANPLSDDDEFVELENKGPEKINLFGFVLAVGSRSAKISWQMELKPGQAAAIYEDDLPVKLRNSGQVIILTDPWGREAAKAEYGKALAGLAYALGEDGSFSWTEEPTPGAGNIFILGEASGGEVLGTKTGSATKTSTQDSKTIKELAKLNRELAEKVDQLQASLQTIAEQVAGAQTAAGAGETCLAIPAAAALESGEQDLEGRPDSLKYLLLSLVSFVVLAFLAIRYWPKKPESITGTSTENKDFDG